MRSILTLVLLSMWMAVPVKAEMKVVRPAKFTWTAAANSSTDTVRGYAAYILPAGSSIEPTFIEYVTPYSPNNREYSITRSFKEKFSLVTAAVGSVYRGLFSDPSEIISTYPNFDYNGNGVVDPTDYIVFKSDYLTTNGRSDANLDGVVSNIDFTAFKNVYGLQLVNGVYQ